MIKLNNGNPVIICDKCRTIISYNVDPNNHTGQDICDKCRTTNNFKLLEERLSFGPNEFYFVQIIQRKKDNIPNLHSSNDYRKIKSYNIFSIEELEEKKDRIINLCINNNARAYITVNVRNSVDISLECIKKYVDIINNNTSFKGDSVWDSCCKSYHSKNSKFLVDVDSTDLVYLEKVKKVIESCRGAENKILYEIPSPHGFHLITNRFDIRQFNQNCVIENIQAPEVSNNGSTLLYYYEKNI